MSSPDLDAARRAGEDALAQYDHASANVRIWGLPVEIAEALRSLLAATAPAPEARPKPVDDLWAACGCPDPDNCEHVFREAPAPLSPPAPALRAGDVEWVVNSLAELGVKIGDKFFFLYKGESRVYDDPSGEQDGEAPLMWRHVFKREFGECCHPLNDIDPTRYGTVDRHDSDEWKPLPRPVAAPKVPPAPASEVLEAKERVRDVLDWYDRRIHPPLNATEREAIPAMKALLAALDRGGAR